MSEFFKTLRENIAAVITALLAFLLVGNYIAVVIPRNEKNLDDSNKSMVEEFNLQFNNTLKDFASQVDTFDLKENIRTNAYKLGKDTQQTDTTTAKYRFLKNLQSKDSILRATDDNVIIQSATITNIINESGQVKICKTVKFNFSKFIRKKFGLDNYPEMLQDLTTVKDTAVISKSILKRRICGAIAFKQWAIYTIDDDKTSKADKEFLSNDIDQQEIDSIQKSPSKLGVLTFKFSEKRFYRKGISVNGIDFHLMLVGAVDQEQFEAAARKADMSSVFICIFLVISLLLSIPLIKPLISSKKEKLTQFDLLATTISIGMLAIVLVCFCFSNYLSQCYKNSLQVGLKSLNDSVRTNFNTEFSKYTYWLNQPDIRAELQSAEQPVIHSYFDSYIHTDSLKKKQAEKGVALVRQNIQNLFTFDNSGDIIKDICKKDNYSIRKNFSERDYFKVLQEPGCKDILTAIYSRYDNKFKLAYVRRNLNTFPVANTLSGFAYVPTFTSKFKVNPNSGYMLADTTGRVILHADSSKSLNENVYWSSQRSSRLAFVFHDMSKSFFDVNYNGQPCMFYAQRLSGDNLIKDRKGKYHLHTKSISDFPVYLLSYTNLGFANKLNVYTTINGFLLSLSYVLGITLLVWLFAVFFYSGDVPILSRSHFYWLFPDNSREKEYRFLRMANILLFAFFVVLQLTNTVHILYFALLTGVNLAFTGFVLLNQRLFFLEGKSAAKTKYLTALALTVITAGYIIPIILQHQKLPTAGVCVTLVSHFIFLAILKKDTRKEALPKEHTERSNVNKRPLFIAFFSSLMCYHFLLVPAFIIFGLFNNEINRAENYYRYADKTIAVKEQASSIVKDAKAHHPATDKTAAEMGQTISRDYTMPNELLFNAFHIVSSPSIEILKNTSFTSTGAFRWDPSLSFRTFLLAKENGSNTFALICSLLFALIFINGLINFYSGRFFFFELCEAYRLGYFKVRNPFTNFKVIIPPYNEADLENLEQHERFDSDIHSGSAEGRQNAWLKDISTAIVSNKTKLDLIMMDNIKIYKPAYQEAWDKLTPEEKFVMNDFADDHFVNYKNRDVLMSLMERGYVIADPLTGRLRVMNYGFRNFITNLEINDPQSAEAIKEQEEKTKGTFSKWRLPIIIVAISGLLLLMYLYKDSFNNFMLLGGSVVSVMGLLAKFMDTTKK